MKDYLFGIMLSQREKTFVSDCSLSKEQEDLMWYEYYQQYEEDCDD